jgi:hypothetical protein
MGNTESGVNHVDYKPLSLPGNFFTYMISMVSLSLSIFLLIPFIDMILTESYNREIFNDLGPVILIALAVGYLFFSYRIVICRDEDTLIVYRQFFMPQIQFLRREYPVNSLTADEVTYAGDEDSSPTTYTTLYSGGQVVTKFSGHKKKLRHVLPELLMPKTESSDDDNTTTQQFWSNVSRDS